jgi:hypothetical protein
MCVATTDLDTRIINVKHFDSTGQMILGSRHPTRERATCLFCVEQTVAGATHHCGGNCAQRSPIPHNHPYGGVAAPPPTTRELARCRSSPL